MFGGLLGGPGDFVVVSSGGVAVELGDVGEVVGTAVEPGSGAVSVAGPDVVALVVRVDVVGVGADVDPPSPTTVRQSLPAGSCVHSDPRVVGIRPDESG